jgi:Ser-tRNA(Ala) deacylase AlaX
MTALIYLTNTYLAKFSAQLLAERNDDFGTCLILDQTIFYPQGGGQPADVGVIKSDFFHFTVNKVRLNENGQVLHYGQYDKGSFEIGAVDLSIDIQNRIINAKVHSAGHLLDCAVANLGIGALKPTKGFHFPEGPYVEYNGVLENHQDWILPIENKINELIANSIAIEAYELSAEQAAMEKIWAPPGKSARVVAFSGFEGCGCGGTHVKNTSEIGKVSIRKIKVKKGVTRIAYAIVLA